MPFQAFQIKGWWDEDWFLEFSIPAKAVWYFLHNHCDNAGVWSVSKIILRCKVGPGIDLDQVFSELSGKIEVLDEGHWWLVNFIREHHLKGIQPGLPFHKPVFDSLEKWGLFGWFEEFEWLDKEGKVRLRLRFVGKPDVWPDKDNVRPIPLLRDKDGVGVVSVCSQSGGEGEKAGEAVRNHPDVVEVREFWAKRMGSTKGSIEASEWVAARLGLIVLAETDGSVDRLSVSDMVGSISNYNDFYETQCRAHGADYRRVYGMISFFDSKRAHVMEFLDCAIGKVRVKKQNDLSSVGDSDDEGEEYDEDAEGDEDADGDEDDDEDEDGEEESDEDVGGDGEEESEEDVGGDGGETISSADMLKRFEEIARRRTF